MSGKLRIGIIGCGDFLRLRAADLLSSRQVEVKLLYSPVNSANAERYAEIFGAKAADSPEELFDEFRDSVYAAEGCGSIAQDGSQRLPS